MIFKSGFVFYGGFIGGAIALLVTLKKQKKDIFKIVDIFAVALPLGHAFGRVGCFFSGCCSGMPYDGWLSFTYKTALDASTPIGVPLLPVQLIEAFVLFVLFAVLLICYLKCPNKKGLCTTIYAYSYAVIRFVLEFFRYDTARGGFLGLSTSQWISIAIFVVTTVWLVVSAVKKKKEKKEVQV
jgi:phosphatidylglycerol:prolipoprotein diacylglycerol transferase